MQYMLMIYESAHDTAARTDPERQAGYWSSWMAYAEALTKSGLVVGGNALQPPGTGTTVRLRNGERQVQDGPFADAKEQLGGYWIIEAPDLDVALDWASKAPIAVGGVEVRPILSMNSQ